MIKIPPLKTGHKIAAGTVLFIFLMVIFYGALNQTVEFFRTNTIVKHQILKVEIHWPLEVVKLTELEKRQAQEKMIEEKSTEWARYILTGGTEPQLTPNPENKTILKVESLLPKIKQVEARDNYTYQKHSQKPYYDQVIAGLQKRFTNWQDAAQLEALEGGFDPGAINPTSGACGLPQALPCKKMGCSLTDIDCQLDWMKKYIGDRYTTVDQALQFRILNSWY